MKSFLRTVRSARRMEQSFYEFFKGIIRMLQWQYEMMPFFLILYKFLTHLLLWSQIYYVLIINDSYGSFNSAIFFSSQFHANRSKLVNINYHAIQCRIIMYDQSLAFFLLAFVEWICFCFFFLYWNLKSLHFGVYFVLILWLTLSCRDDRYLKASFYKNAIYVTPSWLVEITFIISR